MNKQNILLIGMPGTGKSTLGKLLSDALGKRFVDTDDLISELLDMPTQEALDTLGSQAFNVAEQKVLMNLSEKNAVIATGGSAIYQKEAIQYLKKDAVVVHLSASYETLTKRIDNFSSRAIVMAKDMSFQDLYNERTPLYEAAADILFVTDQYNQTPQQSLELILKAISQYSDVS